MFKGSGPLALQSEQTDEGAEVEQEAECVHTLKLVAFLQRTPPPNKRVDECRKMLQILLTNFCPSFGRLPLKSLQLLAQQVEIIACPSGALLHEEVGALPSVAIQLRFVKTPA